ncbi:MAG: protein kinase [Planctomycetaceae bacterium]
MATNEQLELPHEQLLERAVAEYLTAVDQGKAVSVEELIAKHPSITRELRDFFATIGSIEQMAGPVSAESTQSHLNAAIDTCLGDAVAQSALAFDPALQSAEVDDSIMNDSKFDAEAASMATMITKDAASESSSNSNSLSDVAPDGMFGRYRIEKELGQGAMGAVYLAHDTELGRDVALKIPKFSRDDVEVMERFIREARSAATLHHRNICPVFDVGEINGQRFITMAFIDGKPLSSYARSGKRIPEKQVALLVRRLATALEKAHEKGVLHRDLKPANIMLDNEGEPVVMDFGLARRLEPTESERITQSGTILGSPAYMSPEQIEGMPDEINAQADVYSLGVVFYELLTGSLPFKGSIASVIGQIMSKRPVPPSKLRPGLDPALEAICLKMIAKKKGERFKSMKEVADALGQWLTAPPATTTKSSPAPVVAPAPPITASQRPANASPGPRELPQKTSPPKWWSKRPIQLGGFGLFALILAGVVMILQTSKGTIRIETSDPSIQIQVEGETVILSQTGEQEIRLTPGTREITVLRDGFTFGTTSLTLTKGEVITVKVDLLNQNAVQLTQKETGKPIAKLAPSPKSENPTGEVGTGMGTPSTPSVAGAPSSTNPSVTAISDTARPFLRFDLNTLQVGDQPPVLIESLTSKFKETRPKSFTIETRLRQRDQAQEGDSVIVGMRHTFGIFGGEQSARALSMRVLPGDAGREIIGSTPVKFPAERWVHLAAVVDGDMGEQRFYVDGKLANPPDAIGAMNLPTQWIDIFTAGYKFSGDIDWIRVSDTARYTKEFQPEIVRKTDEQTMAIYNFEEGSGRVLKDSSGNGHDGKIDGAKWVGSPSSHDPTRLSDRQAIELLISRQAVAVIMQNGQRSFIGTLDNIPQPPFELRGIFQNLTDTLKDSITDTDCQLLAKIETIDELNLSGSEATTVGLKEFESSPNIRSLSVPRTIQTTAAVEDAVKIIQSFPNLKFLHFPFFGGDKFINSIRGNTSIVGMSLHRVDVTQGCIADLATLPNLKFLDATDSGFRKGEFEKLADLPQLMHLHVTLHANMSIEELAPLANVRTLKSIKVLVDDPKSQSECDAYVRSILPKCQYIKDDGAWESIRDELIGYHRKTIASAKPVTSGGTATVTTPRQLGEDQQQFLKAVSVLSPEVRRDAILNKLEELQVIPRRISNFKENSEFTELANMPGEVTAARISALGVASIWPLAGFSRLESLDLAGTTVLNFSPLETLPLKNLTVDLMLYNLEGEQSLRNIATLTKINGQPAAQFWKSREENRKEIDAFKEASKSLNTKEVLSWLERKLRELNPKSISTVHEGLVSDTNVIGYDTMEGQKRLVFRFCGNIRDLAPVRAIECQQVLGAMSDLYDLSALQGLPLNRIIISHTRIHDLSPLKGMPLVELSLPIGGCVHDLEPLRGMRLERVNFQSNPISDLSPLTGMPLTTLDINGCPVTDLSPLIGIKLETLFCNGTPLDDITPLAGMPLKMLDIQWPASHDWYSFGNWGPPVQAVKDLSPLKNMPLESIKFGLRTLSPQEVELLKSLPLNSINEMPAADFWKAESTNDRA